MTWLFLPFSWSLPTAFTPCFTLSLPRLHHTVKRTEWVTLVRVFQLRIIHWVWKLVDHSRLTWVQRLELWKKRILISDKTIVQRVVRTVWKRIESNRVFLMSIHFLTVVPRSEWMRSLRRRATAGVVTVAVRGMWRGWIGRMNWEVILRIHVVFWKCVRKWVSDKDLVDLVNYYKADREIIFNAPKEIQMWVGIWVYIKINECLNLFIFAYKNMTFPPILRINFVSKRIYFLNLSRWQLIPDFSEKLSWIRSNLFGYL